MKKWILLLGVLSVGSAFGYTYKITNATQSTIRFKLNIALTLDKNVDIAPGKSATIETAATCAKGFEARALNGEAAGLKNIDGFGLRCWGATITVGYQPDTFKFDRKYNHLVKGQGRLTMAY